MRCVSIYRSFAFLLFVSMASILSALEPIGIASEVVSALARVNDRVQCGSDYASLVEDLLEGSGDIDPFRVKNGCSEALRVIDATLQEAYDAELDHCRKVLEQQFIACAQIRAPRPDSPQSWSGINPDERDLVVERDLYVNGTIYADAFDGSAEFGNLTVNGMFTANNGYYFSQGVPGMPAQALQVTKGPITGPNQFNSIKAAVDSITDASQLKPYTVEVGPGVYFEDTITLKPWVALCGCSAATTFIVAIDPTQTILVGAEDSYVAQMSFEGAAAPGGIAVSFDGGGAGSLFVVTECAFASNDTQVSIVANTPPLANILINNSPLVGTFRRGFFVDGDSGVSIFCYVNNVEWQVETAPFLQEIFYVTGPNVRARAFSSSFYTIAPTPGAACVVRNGARFGLTGVGIRGFAQGIYIPNVGAGPQLYTQATFIVDCTEDMRIENPSSRLVLEGIMDWDKMYLDPGITNITTEILDSEPSGGLVIVGPQRVGADLASVTNISPHIEQAGSLGVISDGLLSLAGGFNIDVQAGTGYVSDPALDYVTWGATTVTIPANTTQFIYVDSDGVVQVSAAAPQEDIDILLGKAEAGAAGVVYVQDMKKDAHHTSSRLDRSWRVGIGSIYATGSITSKNSPTGLKLDVSSGRYYFSTHEYTPSGGAPITFNTFLRSATPGQWIIATGQTDVDYNHYDGGSGAPALLPVNDFARHALYIVNDGAEEKYLFQYGQTVYGSLVDAQNGVIPPAPGSWGGNIALIASIIVENTGVAADQIAEIRDERPTLGFRASGVAAVTVHGDLSGLGADDHPQYILTNGGRVLTGNLNLGGNNITNVNLVDGVDVPAHAARHLPNGADPLTTAVPVNIGTSNQVGIQNSLARSDHVHNHGNLAGGSLHANVTTTTAGFMSAADKVTLDSINPANFVQKSGDTMTGDLSMGGNNITNVNLVDGVDVPSHGSRHNPGGADAVTTAAPVNIGTANAEGSATSLARSDHVHNHGNLAGGALHADATTTVDGFMSAADKTKLDNLDPSLFVLKAGDTMTGTLNINAGASNALNVNSGKFTIDSTTGNTAIAGTLSVTGQTTLSNLSSTGVVHNNASGILSTSLIINADVDATAGIVDTKLATISTAGKVSNSATTATNANTANAIVARDASGNFFAGTITASLNGNASTATVATNFSGSLSGDVTGTQGSTTVAQVGGKTAAQVSTSVDDTLAATNLNTASTIVKRDGSGNFNAGTITASLTGAASLNVLKAGDTMSGDLNMGGNSITNVNLVDGVDVPSHASRHNPGGADALATAVPVTIGTANAEGSAASFARSDHVHSHGNLVGGALHADATTTVDGFMSAADKTKLDGINTSLYVLKAGDTMTGSLVMDNQQQIQLREQTGSGTNYAAIQAPATLAANYTLTLPVDDGTVGQVLSTNGSGVLSWAAPGGVQSTSYKTAVYMSTDQILAASATPETLQFDTELYDPNNNFNTGTYAYTAPVTGYYLVNVNLAVDTANAFDRYLRLLVNGSPVTGYATFWTQVDNPIGYLTVIPLTAGQTLAAQIEGRSGDDVLATYSTMTIHIISA